MWKLLTSFLWKTPENDVLSLDDAYNALAVAEPEPEPQLVEEIRDFETEHRCGEITENINGRYVIDRLFEYDGKGAQELELGAKVSYQLIKKSGLVSVVNVALLDTEWNVVHTGVRAWNERTIIGTVVERHGRTVRVQPGQITVDLNDVYAEFIPRIGDWVELDVKCEVDETVVDLAGTVVEVTRLSPVRPHVKDAKITQWNASEGYGLINTDTFFDLSALYDGYLPVQYDKITALVIESDQGQCTYRALKIISAHLQRNNNSQTPDSCLESHDLVDVTQVPVLNFTQLGHSQRFTVTIETSADLMLLKIETQINGQCTVESPGQCTLKPNQPYSVTFLCNVRSMGMSREPFILHFERFKIKRWVTMYVEDKNAVAVYRKPYRDVVRKFVLRDQRQVIPGQSLYNAPRFIAFKLPDFTPPRVLIELVAKYRHERKLLTAQLEKMKPNLCAVLNFVNYTDRFHTLIHLDEIELMLEMQKYDRCPVSFIKTREFLLWEIENLAEKRPSIVAGDRVIARDIGGGDKSLDYEGFVHKTGKNHLYLKFAERFHTMYDGADYAVFVKMSNTTARREHYAVRLAVLHWGPDYLFPSKIKVKEPQVRFCLDAASIPDLDQIQDCTQAEAPVSKLEWYNTQLNHQQKEAVRNILLGVCRPLPYIIFGPPGTGKTVTLVETVLQIVRLIPHSRVLVAAPSNSAADLLALRLIESGVLKPGDLVRLVAHSAVAGIPVKLAPYSATANLEREGTGAEVTTGGLVVGYNSSVLGRHRITVCTCSSAGVLYSLDFKKGHFSHIVVDEAGQTSEPSALVPLSFLSLASGQAILAGDPMQLGPVILSPLAAEYGLNESYLERLTNRFPYMRDIQGFPDTKGYDPRLITMLVDNYRSLPVLLKLPSLLFYNDDLIATIDEEHSKEAVLWQQLAGILPKTKCGNSATLIFHNIIGENFQTEESPSWSNPIEAYQVFFYVTELYRSGLCDKDIGIITPYKAQIKQIVDHFHEADLAVPRVGTVEEFQGQEYNVIILSTVRSSDKYLAQDLRHALGFVSNWRRLNVSITRAKSLLIVCGNAALLSTDRTWRSVLKYIAEHGAYVGSPSDILD